MKKAILFFLCASFFGFTVYSAEEAEIVSTVIFPPCKSKEKRPYPPKDCGENPQSMRLTVRHIDPGGIGYNQGYTTLEGFFSFNEKSYIPFLDLRGHVFNDGKFAANAGLGFRYISGCRSYGFNSYYDYRTTNRQHYNQIGLGLESIGEMFDVFINGYLPVGDKKSPFFDKHVTTANSLSGEDFSFGFFSGNQLFLTTPNGSITSTTISKKKVEFAMKGIEGFFRFTFVTGDDFFVTAGAGPYYYNGYYGRNAVGGKGIVGATWKQCITARVTGSYDNIFHGRVQGELGLTWTFGPKGKENRRNNNVCCAPSFSQKLVTSPEINEIIVVDRHHLKKKTEVVTAPVEVAVAAINPSTGLPFKFWFVNNTSSSAGTFESPFPTLLAAQNASSPNDVIYVFAGDGTTKGMDAGIYLKNSQMLLGASISHPLSTTQGLIVISAQGSTVPNLSAPPGTGVVNVANNNCISGFAIVTDAAGVLNGSYCIGSASSNTANLLVSHNIMTANNGAVAIFPHNPSGQITIIENTLTSADQKGTFGIYLAQTNGVGTYNIENNQISDFQNDDIHRGPPPQLPLGTGILVLAENDSRLNAFITANQITGCIGNSIDLRAIGTGSPFLSARIENNQLLEGLSDSFGVFIYSDNFAVGQFELIDNTMDQCLFGAIAQADGNSQMTGLIQHNIVSNVGGSGFILQTNVGELDSAITNFTVVSNDISNCDSQGIAVATNGSSSLTARIEDNSVYLNGKAGLYMLSFDSSNCDLIVLNNFLHDNNGGMEVEPVDDSRLNILLQGNAIYNNNDAGLFTHATENGVGKYQILSNTFYNNNSSAANTGSAVTMLSDDSANLCLRLIDNQSMAENLPDYFLSNSSGSSEFDVEPLVGNIGTVMEVLTTPVSTGFCGP